MLERVRTDADPNGDKSGQLSSDELSIADVLRFFRSYWPVIAASALFCLTLGLLYALTAKPTFTAMAQILIEANQQSAPTLANTQSFIAMDTPQVESEVALLQSEQIARKTALLLQSRGQAGDGATDAAKDGKKAEPATQSYFTWLSQLLFGAPEVQSEEEKEARLKALMGQIQSNMDVRRVGLSYVLNVSYKAGTPKMAADFANAIGDAYVQDKLDLRAQIARQGGVWLEARIEELRRAMNDAALDVQVFKAKRDYRLFDKPNGEDRLSDDLPSVGQNSQTAKPSPAPQADVKEQTGKPADAAPEHTTLEELESRSETYKKIYESYLQAYMETVQRQSYPGTNARVVTRADPPLYKSGPKRLLILAGSLVLGTVLGLGISLAHFSLDKTVRSPRQISRALDMPLLGEVTRARIFDRFALSSLIPWRWRRAVISPPRSNFFITENEQFSETARELSATAVALKKVMDARGVQVVGLVGATPDLNSSAIASNLAFLNANAGWRTLLIEMDASSPNLKSFFAPDAPKGLQDLLAGGAAFPEVLTTWPRNARLSLLMARPSNAAWTSEQASDLRSLIDQIANQYDLVLVHMRHADNTNLTLAAVDNIVVVTNAYHTLMPELFDITAALRLAGKQPLGVVISGLA